MSGQPLVCAEKNITTPSSTSTEDAIEGVRKSASSGESPVDSKLEDAPDQALSGKGVELKTDMTEKEKDPNIVCCKNHCKLWPWNQRRSYHNTDYVGQPNRCSQPEELAVTAALDLMCPSFPLQLRWSPVISDYRACIANHGERSPCLRYYRRHVLIYLHACILRRPAYHKSTQRDVRQNPSTAGK